MNLIKILTLAALGAITWTSCQKANARYMDVCTGEMITLSQDKETGEMINAETGKPVKLYVNTKTSDTIWAPTGEVVNNGIRRANDGDVLYVFSGKEDKEYKLEIERDGDYKEKYGDGANEYKVKVEDEGRSYKIKHGDYKKKVEKDGDVKIKDGNVKIKIDGETGERKVKVDD